MKESEWRGVMRKLVDALRALRGLGGDPPRKLEEALTWRENERRVDVLADAALARATALLAGQEPEPRYTAAQVEALAAYAHGTWAGWMRHQERVGGSEFWHSLPAKLALRWKRQMLMAYADLPEEEKKSDRAEADRILTILYPDPKPTEAGAESKR